MSIVRIGLSILVELINLVNSVITYVLDRLYFTQCLISFSSVNNHLHLYAQFLILFHLT